MRRPVAGILATLSAVIMMSGCGSSGGSYGGGSTSSGYQQAANQAETKVAQVMNVPVPHVLDRRGAWEELTLFRQAPVVYCSVDNTGATGNVSVVAQVIGQAGGTWQQEQTVLIETNGQRSLKFLFQEVQAKSLQDGWKVVCLAKAGT